MTDETPAGDMPIFNGTSPIIAQTIQMLRAKLGAPSVDMGVEVFPDYVQLTCRQRDGTAEDMASAMLGVGPAYELIAAEVRGQDVSLDMRLERAVQSGSGDMPGIAALGRLWAHVRNANNEQSLRRVIETVAAQMPLHLPEYQIPAAMRLLVVPLLHHQEKALADAIIVGTESAFGHLILQESVSYLMQPILGDISDVHGPYYLQGVAFVDGYLGQLATALSETVEKPVA